MKMSNIWGTMWHETKKQAIQEDKYFETLGRLQRIVLIATDNPHRRKYFRSDKSVKTEQKKTAEFEMLRNSSLQ
ncbi:hypothetical protein NQ314_002754 [Rhamnusium bicolor]|uniref:Uncharacterized protein n=1 Tax=Rhamnusium bicolor TaxID=1586634 RepID=A0AAV8ZRG2_9CUCU|nr:hypothetical protein NQ314_002754 [Rhamnusium bicolor]